jgi:hypothetical protein
MSANSPNSGDPKYTFDRIHADGIVHNVDAIVRIFLERDVAVLFFEVGLGPPELRAASERGARALGWRGGRIEVGRMNETRAARFASELSRAWPGDVAAVAWLRRRSGNRLFVAVHAGTLCFDFVEDQGFSLVPGTSDAEWLS